MAWAPDGRVFLANDTKLYVLDIASRQVVEVKPIGSPFKSIEGLCVPSTFVAP